MYNIQCKLELRISRPLPFFPAESFSLTIFLLIYRRPESVFVVLKTEYPKDWLKKRGEEAQGYSLLYKNVLNLPILMLIGYWENSELHYVGEW